MVLEKYSAPKKEKSLAFKVYIKSNKKKSLKRMYIFKV